MNSVLNKPEHCRRAKHVACLGTLILATFASAPASADVYLVTDSEGTQRYTTTPESGAVLLLRDAQPIEAPHSKPRRPMSPRTQELRNLAQRLALAHGINPALVDALIETESAYNPNARSPKGAMGLMQLMPATARQFGANQPYDPTQNIEAGLRYLKLLLQQYNDNPVLVLAAYNAGQGNLQRHRMRLPPFQETLHYIPKVLSSSQLNSPTPPSHLHVE